MLITNSGIGGAEKVFYEHSLSFSEHYDVTECYFNLDNGTSPNSALNKIISLNQKAGANIKEKVLNFFKRVSLLKKIKAEGSYSICISHMDGANWVNVLSKNQSVNTIVCIHGSLFEDRNRGGFWKKLLLNKIIVPIVYRKADAIVCVSDHIKFELEQLIGRKSNIYSIPNFFDIAKVRRLSSECVSSTIKLFSEKFDVVVSVGRLAKEKNHKGLIKIFAQERSRRESLKLFIIGAGLEEQEIKRTILEEGLTYQDFRPSDQTDLLADIIFFGALPNPYPILSCCKLLLLTSFNEGFPLVIGEAMICGVPTIAYDCISGPRQILAPELDPGFRLDHIYKGQHGLLVPAQESSVINMQELSNWAEAFRVALDDLSYREHIVKNSFVRVESFSKEVVITRWHSLIDSFAR